MLPEQEFSDYINASYVDVITIDIHTLEGAPEYMGLDRGEVAIKTVNIVLSP